MTRNDYIARAVRRALVMSAVVAASAAGTPAFAQDQDQTETQQTVVVTGSRIIRQDYEANSPIASVTRDALTHNADITLETALNNLPQVVPGGTTTSNNPPNGGQANIDLRGLGPNRNLVLVDGRRPMVSANDLTVDVNTIPAALIDNVEVITGGAGAVYGADAVAGVVNIKLKHNFEGFNLSTSYADSTKRDAEEYDVSALLGGNFADGRGNAVFAYDRASREVLLKSQRSFSLNATSTTSNPPQGVLRWNSAGGGNASNPLTQANVDAAFAKYGVAAGAAAPTSARIGFNQDGTLFAVGTFNSPLDVQHFTDPIDQGVNPRFYPDFYSYNFDPVNLLTLPLNRNSFSTNLHYDLGRGFEVFGQGSWTEYTAATGLAPSPVPGVAFAAPGQADPASEVASPLINTISDVAGKPCQVGGAAGRCTFTGGIPVPVTNPFIPADLAALLATRTGNDNRLAGSGGTEPFLVSFRPVAAGLRQENFDNNVIQYLGGIRGPIGDKWRFETYYMEGRTRILDTQQGNIDTQKVTDLVGAADGGASVCAGGFNFFGQGKISQECLDYVKVTTRTTLTMTERVAQGYVTGDLFEMPAGPFSAVLGAEWRAFDYTFDPGANAGPISGFGASDPEAGRNAFHDLFTEIAIPLAKDASFAKTLDLTLGYRWSRSQFTDDLTNFSAPKSDSNTYKAELSWQPVDTWRFRTSYNRSVRAPNFSELFAGGTSFPQIFDPCSVTGKKRNGADAAQMAALCTETGVSGVGTFVATPGSQAEIDLSGNPLLKPETADTYTLGAVFTSNAESQWLTRLRGTVDFYKIKVKDAILTPDPNESIADCYNYYGNNPTYSATANAYCNGMARGPDIQFIGDYQNDPNNGVFAGLNKGTIDTSGIDLQLDWGFDMEWLGAPASLGSVTTNLLFSRLLKYDLSDTPGVGTIDYAGTVNYFGGGIGLAQTLPKWRAFWNTTWTIADKFSIAARARYIDKMENRMSKQFPGETFKGVGSVTYWDFSAAWRFMEKSEFRLGLNNAFDKQPPTYDPNVQSGTDPSTYDVIGRRVFARIEVQF